MQHSAVVVVFVRLPVPGKVKTRLAAGVGPEKAAAFYKLCAEHACLEVARCPVADGMVFCAAAEDVQGVTDWLAEAGAAALPVLPQVQDGDLGRRMIAALTTAATGGQQHNSCSAQQAGAGVKKLGSYEAAIVIGTDIPDVCSDVLAAAVEALLGPRSPHSTEAGTAGAKADMVLGPAADGGYYLLGFRTEALLRPEVQSLEVFEGVQWSTCSVLRDTVAAAGKLGLAAAHAGCLPTLQDIDTVQDARDWLQSVGSRRTGVSASVMQLQQAVARMVLPAA